MEEEIQDVLKWGLAQNPTLIMDPATWSENDFRIMETTLQNLLPVISFLVYLLKIFYEKFDLIEKF